MKINEFIKEAEPEFIEALEETFGEEVRQLEWSGKNTKAARSEAAQKLKADIENHEFKEGEGIHIITHSHGGNVFKEFTQIYDGERKIDSSVFLGTPHRDDY